MNRKVLYLIAEVVIFAAAASWNVSRNISEEALLSDVAPALREAGCPIFIILKNNSYA